MLFDFQDECILLYILYIVKYGKLNEYKYLSLVKLIYIQRIFS